MASIKGSGGVMCTAICELIVGIILLSIYEAYKAKYISAANTESINNNFMKGSVTGNITVGGNITEIVTLDYLIPSNSNKVETGVTSVTPLDFVFYLSILLNIFSIAGMFGILNSIKELVMIFFAWNAIQLVVTFSFFVDIATVAGIKYFNNSGDNGGVTSAAQAAAAFMFFAFLLSILASFFGIKTLNDFKNKEREDALAINMANTALNNL